MKKLVIIISVLIVFLLVSALGVLSFIKITSRENQIQQRSNVEPLDSESSLANFIGNKAWSNYIGGSPFAEGTVWNFHNDGSFEANVISDYTHERAGLWKLVDFGDGSGWLYVYYNEPVNIQGKMITKDFHTVMHVKADGEVLNMNFSPFWGENLTPNQADSYQDLTISAADLKAFFPELGQLLGDKWVKSSDEHKESVPHELTFYENGTFFANYLREENCNFYGNWSVSSNDRGIISLLMEAPEATCDLRGYKGWGMGSGHTFSITQDQLIHGSFDYYNYHR